MGELSILHLSDIHFKKDKDDDDKIFRGDVQEKMLKTIERHLEKEPALDFIIVIGDIAFSGKKREYEEAETFFDRLKKIVPDNSELLMVPGNHDVDRDEIDEIADSYHVVKNNLVEKLLRNDKKKKDFINAKFRYFRKLARQYNSQLYNNDSEYFWVRNF